MIWSRVAYEAIGANCHTTLPSVITDGLEITMLFTAPWKCFGFHLMASCAALKTNETKEEKTCSVWIMCLTSHALWFPGPSAFDSSSSLKHFRWSFIPRLVLMECSYIRADSTRARDPVGLPVIIFNKFPNNWSLFVQYRASGGVKNSRHYNSIKCLWTFEI